MLAVRRSCLAAFGGWSCLHFAVGTEEAGSKRKKSKKHNTSQGSARKKEVSRRLSRATAEETEDTDI